MDTLPLFHRIAGQPVIVLGEGDAAAAKRRLVERAGGVAVGPGDLHARLAFVALDAPEEAVSRLRGRGVLVNAVDRPDLCDFTVPSLLERGPVIVAVGTGGVSAGLAKALRMRLETILPHSLGALAQALGAARVRLRERWPDANARRRAIDAALARGAALDPLREFDGKAFAAWREGAASDECLNATAEIVLSRADPDDLTLRQARLLGSADRVLHDADVPAAILALARADAVRGLLDEKSEPTPGLTVIIRSR